MRRTVPGKVYTAEEITKVIDEGWQSDEDYRDLCDFVDKAPMNKDDVEKLRISGILDELYAAM